MLERGIGVAITRCRYTVPLARRAINYAGHAIAGAFVQLDLCSAPPA
jgi:hypothetical protein